MHPKDPFHESYYDHSCLIVAERDVLDAEVLGLNWTTSCKRMWYNLFLLSYADERAGDYYHSTHAMRMDRMRHFRRHRNVIHPLSKFRTLWDVFMLHAYILYKIVILCFTSVIFCTMPKSSYYIAMSFEGFLILDIYINSRTGYVDSLSRRMVLDKDCVLLHYCSHKLFFHTLSSIPLVFIMFLRYGDDINCDICKANVFNCVISFFTIVSLFRVNELSSYWNRNWKSFKRTIIYHFVRVGVIIFLILVQFLHYNDTICLIKLMQTSMTVQCEFFDDVFNMKFNKSLVEKPTQALILYTHFWRAVNYMSRPSYNMAPVYRLLYPHPLMSLFSYGLLTTCTIWLTIEIFSFFTRERFFDDEISKSEQGVKNLIKTRQLPEKLKAETINYFDFTATKLKVIEQRNGLYKSLPKILKEEIIVHTYCRLIVRIPYFDDWPKEIIEKLALLLKEQIFLENDVIAEVDEPGEGLMIVDAGVLAVYTKRHEEVGHLIDGDYFGELSLVTDREVTASSVVAISRCKILLLEKIQFRQVMRSHPQIFYWLQEQLKDASNRSSLSEN